MQHRTTRPADRQGTAAAETGGAAATNGETARVEAGQIVPVNRPAQDNVPNAVLQLASAIVQVLKQRQPADDGEECKALLAEYIQSHLGRATALVPSAPPAGRPAGRPATPIVTRAAPGQKYGILRDYEDWLAMRCSPKQVAVLVSLARRFLSAGRDQTRIAAVGDFLSMLRKKGRSVKTLWNVRSGLSVWFSFLIEKDLLDLNPCRGIKLARLERPPSRWLSPKELAKALSVAEAAGVWPEVAMAVFSGMRVSELARLRWEDVDLGRKQVLIPKSKNGRPKTIPLGQTAIAALRLQKKRIGPGYAYVFPARRGGYNTWRQIDRERSPKAWRNAIRPLQKAVPKFTETIGCGRGWHLLRHTFASRAAQAGVPIQKISQWLGHSGLEMTLRYAHLAAHYDSDVERTQLTGEELSSQPGARKEHHGQPEMARKKTP